VGVLGLSDDHVWPNLESLLATEQAVIAAAADPRPELREKARSYGCDRLFDDPLELLDDVELDVVYVFSDNRTSAELAAQAAGQGLHVLVDKPMAADLAGAARMHGAAAAAGVRLMIDWPINWWPSLQHALRLIAEGRIGRILQVDYRAAHAGPREAGCSPAFAEWLYDPRRNGGGALVDYCSYGAALACLLLGLPSRVTAVSGRLDKADLYAEDNAVVVMQHARAISTATGSWTQVGHMTSYVPTFYGTEGTLLVRNDGVWLAARGQESEARLDVPEPSPELRASAALLLQCIHSGEPVTGICGPEVGLAAQEVLEAALISARAGCSVSLPLPVEHIGSATAAQPG
jgi:predicted dehydrogenase